MVLSTARHSAPSAGPPGHSVVRSEGDDERSICAPRIVIVGGGFGGLYAAKALSGIEEDARARLTLSRPDRDMSR